MDVFPAPYHDAKNVCWALYFCDGQYYSNTLSYHFDAGYEDFLSDDYHDIDGHFFVKEISIDEFNSYNYSFSLDMLACTFKNKFDHCETLTVPEGVFERQSGSFVFKVCAVAFYEQRNVYSVASMNFIYIDYEYTDDTTILLSKPDSIVPR